MKAKEAMQAAMTHDELHESVELFAQALGYKTWHDRATNIPGAHINAPGWPDLVAVHPRTGKMFVLEFKVPPDTLSPAQEDWADHFEAVERATNGTVKYLVIEPGKSHDAVEHLLRYSAVNMDGTDSSS